MNNHTAVDHAKPNSNSKQVYKGILKENQREFFNGKIFVRQDTRRQIRFSLSQNVLLSEEASMNTSHLVEIWADDVKCSLFDTGQSMLPKHFLTLAFAKT
jgi:Fe-S cluster assembly protein SufD